MTVDIPAGQSSATVYYIPATGVTSAYFDNSTIAYHIGTSNNPSGTVSNPSTPVQLTYSVTDQANNPLSGVSVTFSLNAGGPGGTLSTLSGVTNSQGQVVVTFTTPSATTWTGGASQDVYIQVVGVPAGAFNSSVYANVTQ